MQNYELPEHLKKMYRHWGEHTTNTPGSTKGIPENLLWFIHERVQIWEKKTSGQQPPFTDDLIMSTFRFCNIFREMDRQTIAIHTQLNPLRDDFPLWLVNMFYARMVARPETMQAVGLLSFDKKENEKWYQRLIHSPRPRYGTPYVFPVSVIQRSNTPTRELFLANYLPTVIPKVAREIQSWNKQPVYEGVEKVLQLFSYRLHFLWTEVLIDVAYQFPQYIDLFKRFPIGPGSAPTFATLSPHGDPSLFAQELADKNITTSITYNGLPLRLSAENWEGIGCEFRKYTNLTNGHGRRRTYKNTSAPPPASLF